MRVFAVCLIFGATVLSFAGCGNQDQNTLTKNDEEKLYAKMVDTINAIPQVDCTVKSVIEEFYGELNTQEDLFVFDSGEKRLYYNSVSKNFNELNEIESGNTKEIWVFEDEENNIEYKKTSDLQNSDDFYTSAKLVSVNHAYNGYVKQAYKQHLEFLFPSSYNDFLKSVDENILDYDKVYEKTINWELKDEERIFNVRYKVEKNNEGKNTVNEGVLEIIFSDKAIKSLKVYYSVSNNGEIVDFLKFDFVVDYNFDASKFATLSKSEFEGVELQKDYVVKKNLIINSKTKFNYFNYFNFNTNVVSTLSARLQDYRAVFSFYSDADCKNRISDTDKFTSYESTIYCQAVPESGYALILFYGDDNSLMTTNENNIELTDTDRFIYKINGKQISGNMLEIEPNEVYCIETVYIN